MNLFAVAIISCDFARHCIAVTKIVAGIIGNFDMPFSGVRNSIDKSQWPVMSIAVDIHCFSPPISSLPVSQLKYSGCEVRARFAERMRTGRVRWREPNKRNEADGKFSP